MRVLENVRGRHTFLVQGTAFPANDNFMELLFWIDALKRASAESVTAVIPYFSYAKGDKKDEPRVSIRARVCADAIEAAGVDRVVTMDLHAPQLQGFFHVPVDDLYAMPTLCDAIAAKALPRPRGRRTRRRASPSGRARTPSDWACRTRSPTRSAPTTPRPRDMLDLIGDVDGKTALIVDDFTISAGSLVDAARIVSDRGAAPIYAMVSHGLLTETAVERLADSPIERLFITDTVETQPVDAPRQGRGDLGRRALRRGHPPHPPPREHQHPL